MGRARYCGDPAAGPAANTNDKLPLLPGFHPRVGDHLALGFGRYEVRARTTDFVGERTKAFSAGARTLTGLRIVR